MSPDVGLRWLLVWLFHAGRLAALDWDLPDPAGLDLAAVRPIRDDIARRVQQLLADLLQQTPRP